MRIGDVGTRHPDHIELAGRDGVARRREVLDARGVEDRNTSRRAHLAGEVEMRRQLRAHAGNDVRERLVGVDMAAYDVDEVDLAACGESLCDGQPILARQALLPILVADHAQAEDEIGADPVADRPHHLLREAHAVVERAAIIVGPLIGRRRPELIGKMAVALDLDAVHAAYPAALGGIGVVAENAGNVPLLERLGKGAMRRLADRARRHHRQPIRFAPGSAAAEMGDLDHHRGAVRMDVVGELGEPANHLVLVEEDVAEDRWAVGRDDGRAADHGERDAAFGLLGMVEPITRLRHAVLGIGGLMRRRQEAVAQREVLQAEGLQQGIVRAHRRYLALRKRR